MRTDVGRRHAMTAIEVLVATMLASLMLASVVGVLGSLARQERSLRGSNCDPYWRRMLSDQFLWDFRNSRQIAVNQRGMTLSGFAGRSFSNGLPTGRPTQLDYYLLEVAGDRWLVRRERHLDEHSTNSSRTEYVCRGVGSLRCGSVLIDQPQSGSIAPDTTGGETRSAIPARIALAIFGNEPDTPLLDKVFFVR